MPHRTLTALVLLALPAAAGAVTPDTPARLLAGRVAGPPQACIGALDRDRESQLFRDGSILYRGRSSTWWLNKPGGCPAFHSDQAITNISPTGSLCRGDIIQVIDPTSGFFYGSCPLGAFVPYKKTR